MRRNRDASAARSSNWSRRRWMIGGAFAVVYIGTIIAANWAIQHLGRPPVAPGAPHTIPVWPGIVAPSGVLFAGLAFTARDLTQEWLGRVVVSIAILIGAACSFAVASGRLALASGVAFLLSEAADLFIYTPLRQRRWWLAVLASNVIGLVTDSIMFLWIAFNSLEFLSGQVVGKAWMTVLALAVLVPLRRSVIPQRREELPADEPKLAVV